MSEQHSRHGDCRPIALTDEFNYVHPRVASGSSRQWVMGKLGPRRMLAVVYAMVPEVSYINLKALGLEFHLRPGQAM